MGGGRTAGWQHDLNRAIGAGSLVGLDDAELLGRFVKQTGGAAEVAFEAIVARHGPMVLGVCRRLLRHPADADDAFQATFLVLVRKAASVQVGDSLGPWLYGVAQRVATRSRTDARRIRSREVTGLELPPRAVLPPDPSRFDLAAVVAEELDRLPARYRSAVILCHLEGLSHEEAARRLSWPVGTLSGRLSRARSLLRSRFERRGLSLPGVGLTGLPDLLLPRTVPAALTRATLRVATGGPVAVKLASLTQGALLAMTLTRWKSAILAGSILATLSIGMSYVVGQVNVPQPRPPASPPIQPAAVIRPEIADLIRRRIEVARGAYAEAERLIYEPPATSNVNLNGQFYSSQLPLWSVRWMEAERDLDDGQPARTAALRGHLGRMKAWEKRAAELIDGESCGLGSESLATARYHRLQAEYWIARETP